MMLSGAFVICVGGPWFGYALLGSRLGIVVGGAAAVCLTWLFRKWVTRLSVEVGGSELTVMGRCGDARRRGSATISLGDICAIWDGWEEKRARDDGSCWLLIVKRSGEMLRVGPWAPAFLAAPEDEAKLVRDWLARAVAARTGRNVECGGRSQAYAIGPLAD